MIKILVLKEDTIDEISRETGQSPKSLKMKLKEANAAEPKRLICFTVNSLEGRKI